MSLTHFPYGISNWGIDTGGLTTYTGATDAIAFPGTAVLLRAGAVDAATLADPVATADDGKVVTIVNGTTQANTVTAGAGKIQDGTLTPKTTITMPAFEGAAITLMAYQGSWVVLSNQAAVLS